MTSRGLNGRVKWLEHRTAGRAKSLNVIVCPHLSDDKCDCTLTDEKINIIIRRNKRPDLGMSIWATD
jgi:hypothetical protein